MTLSHFCGIVARHLCLGVDLSGASKYIGFVFRSNVRAAKYVAKSKIFVNQYPPSFNFILTLKVFAVQSAQFSQKMSSALSYNFWNFKALLKIKLVKGAKE